MIFISSYDADRLESLKILRLGVEIDYPVNKIKTLNSFSASDINW